MNLKNKTSILNLEKSVSKIKTQSDAPVHLWNPEFCGNLNIRIARDGNWFHDGNRITRPKLVKLFSSILKKEGNNYFLVTPVEKIGIQVDDAPFVANSIDFKATGRNQKIYMTTQVGDTLLVGERNPLRIEIDPESEEPSPYVKVRRNLDALIDRKSFYRLIDRGETKLHNGEIWFGVWSDMTFFPISLMDEISE